MVEVSNAKNLALKKSRFQSMMISIGISQARADLCESELKDWRGPPCVKKG